MRYQASAYSGKCSGISSYVPPPLLSVALIPRTTAVRAKIWNASFVGLNLERVICGPNFWMRRLWALIWNASFMGLNLERVISSAQKVAPVRWHDRYWLAQFVYKCLNPYKTFKCFSLLVPSSYNNPWFINIKNGWVSFCIKCTALEMVNSGHIEEGLN